jgi:hypothetical protein
MNHTFIASGLNGFKPSLNFLSKYDSNYQENISLVLGEVGCYMNGKASEDKLQNTFSSNLWTADYLLYAMSLVNLPSHFMSTQLT